MTGLKVKIHTNEDDAAGNYAIEATPDKIKESADMTVVIMEDATVQKQAGLAFAIKDAEGNYHIKQITETNMEQLISTFRGALERFKDLKKKRKS